MAEAPVLDEARATTKRVARTFALACRLLPREVRDDVYLLYLVFRTLDDAVDEGWEDAEERIAAVEAWCREGLCDDREPAVLAELDARYTLPRDSVLEFCRGMRHDLEGRTIATEAELELYCHRVAGTVGEVMSALLGVQGDVEEARRRAGALGKAMQRTNILRDIDEDLANGRVYLARETLDQFGSCAPGSREALLRDQIRRADELYDEGIAGIGMLVHGRRAIAAAAAMYREILRQIEREGYGQTAGRAVVRRRRKLVVAARNTIGA